METLTGPSREIGSGRLGWGVVGRRLEKWRVGQFLEGEM